jgi:hypothetical protein
VALGLMTHRNAHSVIDRARDALAQPEPEQPTVMEIIELANEIEAAELGQVDLVRAALRSLGQPVSNAYNITVALEPRSWAVLWYEWCGPAQRQLPDP